MSGIAEVMRSRSVLVFEGGTATASLNARGGAYAMRPDAECLEAADEIDRLRARIAELERAQQWQPIETAPKDGRVICGFSAAWGDQWPCCAVAWRDGNWRFVHVPMVAMPQHWMPLPKAPKP